MAEPVRLQRYLAAAGVAARRKAEDLITAGRVTVNGETAKPATRVVVGDEVRARGRERVIVYQVTGLLERRVSAPVAATCYLDQSPPPPAGSDGRGALDGDVVAAPGGVRLRGEGRPTKRERRQLDQLRRRSP